MAALAGAALLLALPAADFSVLTGHAPSLLSRAALAAVSNIAFALAALAVGGLSRSGATAATLVGTVVLAALGWPGWLLLSLAFAVALASTRYGAPRKAALGIAEDRGGRRAAGNVVANMGVATLAAGLSVASLFPAECALAFSAALVTSASDTAASEIGKAFGGRTWLTTSWRIVPPGAIGAVSMAGTIGGACVAVLMSTAAWAGGLLAGASDTAIVAGAALAALLLEGVISATFEERGWLDNDGVNFLGSLIGAALALGGASLSVVRAVP